MCLPFAFCVVGVAVLFVGEWLLFDGLMIVVFVCSLCVVLPFVLLLLHNVYRFVVLLFVAWLLCRFVMLLSVCCIVDV